MRFALATVFFSSLLLSIAARNCPQHLQGLYDDKSIQGGPSDFQNVQKRQASGTVSESSTRVFNGGDTAYTRGGRKRDVSASSTAAARDIYTGTESPARLPKQGTTARTTSQRTTGTRSTKSTAKSTSRSTTTSATKSAVISSETASVRYDQVNVTLARMPKGQVMCKNTSEVESGTVLNVTWFSKGAYTNTVYLRYATDGYQTWNTAPGGTLPPYAGQKLSSNSSTQDPDATYRMTFQTQVYAYQKGIIMTILVFDNQKNITVVSLESPRIIVQHTCQRRSTTTTSSSAESERTTSTKAQAQKVTAGFDDSTDTQADAGDVEEAEAEGEPSSAAETDASSVNDTEEQTSNPNFGNKVVIVRPAFLILILTTIIIVLL